MEHSSETKDASFREGAKLLKRGPGPSNNLDSLRDSLTANFLAGKTVVFITDVYTIGGALFCLIELVEELTKTYHIRCIVLTSQRSWVNKRLDEMNLENYVTGHDQFLIEPPRSKWKKPIKYVLFGIRHLLTYYPSLWRAERQVDFSHVDIIHSNMVRTDLGEALARYHHIPHICHLREFSFSYFHVWSIRAKPASWISDNSKVLIPVSNAVAEAWERKGADQKKMRVVYDGVEVERIARSATDYNCSRSAGNKDHAPLRLVFIGGLSEEKGVWDALGALKRVCEDGYNATLDIYGAGDDAAFREFNSRITQDGLSNLVVYHGYNPGASEEFGRYDVGLVCTKLEGFGRAVIEFYAAGLAVIAANRGALPELIEDGKTGFLYDNTEQLAIHLETLSDDRSLLQRIQSAGHEKAWYFTSARTAEKVANVYSDLLSNMERDLTVRSHEMNRLF